MKPNFFSKNLRYLRAKRGLEQRDISELLNLKSPTSVTNWEKGNNMARSGHLNDLANFFGVNMDDLVNKDLSSKVSGSNMIRVTEKDFVAIPILGEISCGEPLLAEENIYGYRYHLKDTLPGGKCFYLKAKGDSMFPTIKDGSDVLIRLQEDVENGEIAAVLVNGDTEATLKRVYKQGDNVNLIAENPIYPPYIVNESNPARILGKAVEVSFDL